MPRAELEALRSLDPETFAAHYQQQPLSPGGLIIRRSWLRFYDVLPPRNASSVVLQSWDTANKISGTNDWSVCTTWVIQDANYYLIDVLRERLDYPSLRERAIGHARTYKADKIVVEEAVIGAGLIQELQKLSMPVVPVRPVRNKISRMQEQSLKFQRGNVYLPRHAPWLSDYQGELLAFPHARFDDQADSTSQALAVDHSTYDPKVLAEGMARLYTRVSRLNHLFAAPITRNLVD
jgi:predicted phage terminase large subunit-like protein